MSFFYSESKPTLPLRERKKLPLRGKRARRLKLLTQFEVGRVYTFCPVSKLDDLPDDNTLWCTADDWPVREVRI